MRKIARRDANHAEIVKAFRKLGWSVLDLAQIGGGCPDLYVARPGRSTLVEVKDGAKPPSQRVLTPLQVKFRAEWRGDITIVTSVADVMMISGAR